MFAEFMGDARRFAPPPKYARDYTTLHIGKDTRIGLRRLTDCTSLNLIQEVLCVLSLLAEIFFVIHVTRNFEVRRSKVKVMLPRRCLRNNQKTFEKVFLSVLQYDIANWI